MLVVAFGGRFGNHPRGVARSGYRSRGGRLSTDCPQGGRGSDRSLGLQAGGGDRRSPGRGGRGRGRGVPDRASEHTNPFPPADGLQLVDEHCLAPPVLSRSLDAANPMRSIPSKDGGGLRREWCCRLRYDCHRPIEGVPGAGGGGTASCAVRNGGAVARGAGTSPSSA